MNKKWTRRQVTAAGLLVAAVGIVVLVGSATHIRALVQLTPTSPDMRRNTALGLVVCGLGMISLTSRRRTPTLLAGAFCALLGFLTAVEYVFGLSLGLDELLGKSYFVAQTLPGRMSIVTAHCFMLAGCAIFSWRWNAARRFRCWIAGILASMLAAIGSVSSMGYLFGNTSAYGWDDLTRIALHTALAFALVGISLLIFVWGEERATQPTVPGSRYLPEWLPLSAGIGVLTATLGIWQALLARRAEKQPLLSEIVLAFGVVFALLVALGIHVMQRGKGSPEGTMVAGFGLAFATLIAVGIVQYRNIQALVETDRWVAGTYAVLTELEAAYSDLQRAESGTRGYAATGQEEYRSQQEAGIADSKDHLRALRSLIAEDSQQQPNLYRLAFLAGRKVAMMQHLVALRRDQGFAAASQELRKGEGLRLMNEIRALVDAMQAEESGLLAARQAASTVGARRADAVTAFGTLLAVVFVLAAGWITSRDALERRRAEDALRDSEARLSLALDAAQTGVWELDLVNDTSVRSLRHDQIFGYLSLVPKWGYEIFISHVVPEDRAGVKKRFDEAYASGHLSYECRIKKADDNSLRWIAAQGRVYRNDQGHPVRMLGVVADITERRRAEEEIRQLNADLERRVAERTAELAAANQELEAFTYSVAHDLRGPLRSMDGFSLALLEDYGGKLDEQGQSYAQRIRAATLRMAQLIDDLLSLSRISRSEVRKERVDLSALAQAVVSDLQKSDPERLADFVIEPSLEAEGDPRLLRVALENLLGNAWKFSAQRHPARIELGLAKQNGRKTYFVRDNGSGFDMAYAGKLFAPFQRLHSATEFPGTGIGLATVRRIVRKHGGDIAAEGAVGQGATFYFTLGQESETAVDLPSQSSSPTK